MNVHNSKFYALFLYITKSFARCRLGIVDGANNVGMRVEIGEYFTFVESVIAEGNYVDFIGEKLIGDLWSYADSGGTIFAVDNDKEGLELRPQVRELFNHGIPSGSANDIAEKKDAIRFHKLYGTELNLAVREEEIYCGLNFL